MKEMADSVRNIVIIFLSVLNIGTEITAQFLLHSEFLGFADVVFDVQDHNCNSHPGKPHTTKKEDCVACQYAMEHIAVTAVGLSLHCIDIRYVTGHEPSNSSCFVTLVPFYRRGPPTFIS